MIKLFSTFINRFGHFGFLRIVFYPLTTLFTTSFRLMQTLWNCRVLVKDNNCDYLNFSPYNGIDHALYWVVALVLSRFGRRGVCPYIGFGNYSLSRLFHYCKFSVYPYWKASNITLLVGMFGWALMHFVWVSQVNTSQVVVVVFLAVVSTTFYANTFTWQNYNVLGWIFFPLGLYGIFTQNWLVAAAAWFFASLSSFTVVLMGGVISIASAIANGSLLAIFALIPAALKVFVQVLPFFISKNMKISFLHLMKAIGFRRKGTRYKYILSPKTILASLYFLLLYIQFIVVFYIVNAKFPVLFLTGLMVFILNSSGFIRFIDTQSSHMLMGSLAAAYALMVPEPLVIISFWVVISPLPLLIPFPFMKGVLDVVPKAAPFSVKELKKGLENFLSSVSPKERLLMAFNNPGDKFAKLFDGYRALLQLALYVAAEKEICFMPDWMGVFELNYEGAPNCWGRDLESVMKNIKLWQADYVVVYQNSGTKLDEQWRDAGFEVLNRFSWADYEKELRGIKPYLGETPDWWLLKIPQIN